MADDIRARILAEARARFRIPYGLPPGPGQTDCSKYVKDVYEAAGLPFSPNVRTAEQERADTVPIGWSEVLPGDLLFFERTYDITEPSRVGDGHVASHIGISLGAGTRRMYDANNGRGTSGETNIDTAYWQEHIFEARRHPALAVADPGDEPPEDQELSFEELWPTIKAAGAEFGFDARVLAGIMKQESGWTNWRVHRDGTGHGLLGLDDNGMLPGFERWSGLSIGRGHNARTIPIEPQIRYAAFALADYANRLGGPYAAARAWHRGQGGMNDSLGQNYERLIRAHVAELFGAGEPLPAPTPPRPAPADPRDAELAALRARVGGLETAVAHLADILAGDKLQGIQDEARAIRTQFLGKRP